MGPLGNAGQDQLVDVYLVIFFVNYQINPLLPSFPPLTPPSLLLPPPSLLLPPPSLLLPLVVGWSYTLIFILLVQLYGAVVEVPTKPGHLSTFPCLHLQTTPAPSSSGHSSAGHAAYSRNGCVSTATGLHRRSGAATATESSSLQDEFLKASDFSLDGWREEVCLFLRTKQPLTFRVE